MSLKCVNFNIIYTIYNYIVDVNLMHFHDITNDYRLMLKFIDMIYMIIKFNQMVDFEIYLSCKINIVIE